MKSCDVIQSTLDALTKETPATKPFVKPMLRVSSNMLRHMDPIKQLQDAWITAYKMGATIRYLDKNIQRKKLYSPNLFNQALQYNPAMEVNIKMHMSFRIKNIKDPAIEQDIEWIWLR